MINYKILKDCPVFQGINENEIKIILDEIHLKIKVYKKDEVVALAGEQVENLYIIMSGSVRGEMIDYSGKTIKIEDIEAPRPLATAFLFGKENTFPVTVTAVSDTEILSIPVRQFLNMLQKNTRLLKNYLNIISSRSQFLSRKLHFLSFKTIKGKMAHFLIEQAGETHHSVELKNNRQQLADLFGVTRPALARVLGEMQNEKIIKADRKIIKILDREKLVKIIHHG